MISIDQWFWLAISGRQCVAYGLPLPSTVRVIPSPERLIGFLTRSEQLDAQRVILVGSVAEMARLEDEILAKTEAGLAHDICFQRAKPIEASVRYQWLPA